METFSKKTCSIRFRFFLFCMLLTQCANKKDLLRINKNQKENHATGNRSATFLLLFIINNTITHTLLLHKID